MPDDDPNLTETLPQGKSIIPDSYLKRALRQLAEPSTQPWTDDARFVVANRRPMITYPMIFISPHELAQVFRIFEESMPDQKLWRRAFEKCQSTLESYAIEGRPLLRVNPFNWLSGWILNEVLVSATQTQRLQNSEGRRSKK